MLLLLTFALLTQQPDLGITYQQEEFVREFTLRERVAVKIPLPLEELGSPEWQVRHLANKRLISQCHDDANLTRWLFWGRHSGDYEVAFRCNAALKILYLCQNCNGKGQCGDNYKWDCDKCVGTGTLWGLTPWD